MDTLLFKSAIFLLAAILTVPVAKFLRLGSVLGYLVAGVAIGPYMLGFLGIGDQAMLLHTTEFGVVMMLFMIGLEVKPSFLWKLRVPILGMGGLQMLLSALALAGVGMALGLRWQSALAVGMILGLSSTAIIIQTLSEKGQLGGRVGRTSFSVLLFQDIAVIPILAILPMLALQQSPENSANVHGAAGWLAHQPGYIQFAAIILAMAVVIFGGHFLSGKIFRLIAATKMRDIFTATVLFLVVSVALLMNIVGLSAALGTFLAGVMLADSEYRHEIELSIEPFKGLLLGLFFISVGAGIDFNLFRQNVGLIVSLVGALIVVKWIVLFFLAKLFAHNTLQSLLFAFLMAQGGEFAFVLFSYSKQNNILPAGLADMLVVVVTVSMLVTPLLMLLFERAERRVGSKKRTEQQKDEEIINENAGVIIAGYGRFSQIIGRLLLANGENCTILDNNPQIIELLKRFGQKVYYGDATRPDLLEAAGAKEAKVLIVGLRNIEQTEELIQTVHKHFPHLKIIARAFDRVNAYRLIRAGVNHMQREHLNSALELGEKALIELGYHPYNAHRQAHIFKQHDEKMLLELYEIWNKDPEADLKQRTSGEYISHVREMTASIEAVLRSDRYSRSLKIESDHAWESPPGENIRSNPKIDEEKDDKTKD